MSSSSRWMANRVHGWVGILARGSREEAGFSIIHCGRVVQGLPGLVASRISLRSVPRLERSRQSAPRPVKIHLNDFDVSHTKGRPFFGWRPGKKARRKRSFRNTAGTTETSLNSIASEATTAVAHHRLKQIRTRRSSSVSVDSPEIVDVIEIEQCLRRKPSSRPCHISTKSVVETRDETLKAKVGDLTRQTFHCRRHVTKRSIRNG